MLLLALSASFAQAPPNSGFDAHGFRLAAHDPDPLAPLVVPRPKAFGERAGFGAALVEYASQPLVFEREQGQVVELEQLVGMNLSAGYAPIDRLRLDLALPLFFAAQGSAGPLGPGFGDLRATGQVVLVAPDPDEGGLGLGLLGNLDLPTGRPEAFLGLWSLGGGVGLAATWQTGRVAVGGFASSQVRPNTAFEERPAPTRGGDAFAFGGSVGARVTERTGMTLEIHAEVPVDDAVRVAIGVPAEALLSLKQAREDGAFLTAGFGAGITRGAGASPLRLLVGGGYGRAPQIVKDLDGDGLSDDVDGCPASPETVNGYLDDDGCPDELPVLSVRVVDASGEPVADAVIEAEGPMNALGSGSLAFRGPQVLPGVRWVLRATRGSCLAGEVEHVQGPGDETVEVVLAPSRTATLAVEVSGADGEPFEGARLSVQSEDPACAPDTGVTDADGRLVLPIGPGQHFAFVSAEGYAIVRKTLQVADQGSAVLVATMQPTRVRVGADAIEILETVFFDTAKATIQARSHALLDEVASTILAQGVRVEIQGHTDDRGPADANLALSQARADAVRTYLIARGVSAERLVARGYGEASPIAENRTEGGRAKNRRVEFRILPTP